MPRHNGLTISWWYIGAALKMPGLAWGADLLTDDAQLVRPFGHDESFAGDCKSKADGRAKVRKLARRYGVAASRIHFDPDTTQSMAND